jgi:hypothetical protein
VTNQTGEHDFESRLDRALEAAPAVKIPEDFALRVAAMAPARVVALGEAAAARRSVGLRIAWVVAAMLLLAMFVLAPSARSGGARRWMEFALEIDFVVLTLWLGMRSLAASR